MSKSKVWLLVVVLVLGVVSSVSAHPGHPDKRESGIVKGGRR